MKLKTRTPLTILSTDNNSTDNMLTAITILIADYDAEDCMLAKEALEENRLLNKVHFVKDGEDLMNYLLNNEKYSNKEEYPKPGILLLDLNMPKMDGRQALKEIKSNPQLKHIPVVVLTSSKAEEDILKTYNLDVNHFIAKPVTFESLITTMRILCRFWFQVVELPH